MLRLLQTQALETALQSQSGVRNEALVAAAGVFHAAAEENAAALSLAASVQVTGLALTAGSVWWALRAGGLLTGLMVSLPAWRHADLLAVLPDNEDDETWDAAEDDEAALDDDAVGQVFESESRGDL
jgi:hypothetical protein